MSASGTGRGQPQRAGLVLAFGRRWRRSGTAALLPEGWQRRWPSTRLRRWTCDMAAIIAPRRAVGAAAICGVLSHAKVHVIRPGARVSGRELDVAGPLPD
ncbi:MAG: hypothetical protein R2851_15175 [Caldilineaceae bacterium]